MEYDMLEVRSTSCGQCQGQTRRTPAWRSTSAGRWRGKPGWILRSRRSTSSGLHAKEARLEESLGAPEPLVADGDHLAVGKLIGLLQGGGGGGGGHLLLEVQCNVAQLLLDVPDNLPLGSGGEGVAPLGEDLHQVVGQLTAGQVKPEDGVG